MIMVDLQKAWDNYHKKIIESINDLKISKKRKKEMKENFILRQKSFIFVNADKKEE